MSFVSVKIVTVLLVRSSIIYGWEMPKSIVTDENERKLIRNRNSDPFKEMEAACRSEIGNPKIPYDTWLSELDGMTMKEQNQAFKDELRSIIEDGKRISVRNIFDSLKEMSSKELEEFGSSLESLKHEAESFQATEKSYSLTTTVQGATSQMEKGLLLFPRQTFPLITLLIRLGALLFWFPVLISYGVFLLVFGLWVIIVEAFWIIFTLRRPPGILSGFWSVLFRVWLGILNGLFGRGSRYLQCEYERFMISAMPEFLTQARKLASA